MPVYDGATGRRSLRSNANPGGEPEREVQPPPAEFVNQYFYKDFGVHGIFVGICVSMCRHGHKNGRDDVYCVQYDDGDVENLQFRDVRKMLKKAPADKTAYTEAEGKRLAVLEALKKSDAAKHKQQAESAQRSAKIQEDTASAAASEAASPTEHMVGAETAPPAIATAAAAAASFYPAAMAAQAAAAQASVAQAAPVGAGVAAFAAAGAVGSTATANASACITAAAVTFPQLNLTDLAKPPAASKPGPKLSELKSPPKSPTKIPQKALGKSQLEKKQKKQQVSHRKRKNSTKSNEDRDDEEAIKARKVRVECSQPGFGWLNHNPCQIARVLGRRTRTVYEYDVEWAGSNLDRTWEPAPNIHSQLVNDFDRLQAQQDAAFAAEPAVVSMVTSPYSTAPPSPNGKGGYATGPVDLGAGAPPGLTTDYTVPVSAAVAPIETLIDPLIGVTATYAPVPHVDVELMADTEAAPGTASTSRLTASQAAADAAAAAAAAASATAVAAAMLTPTGAASSAPVLSAMQQQAQATFGTPSEQLQAQQQHSGQVYHPTVNGQCQHPLCQQQLLIDSYRSVLKFMEPPGWAETAQRIDAIADAQLNSFPITAFLEFYGHTIQEMMQERDARVQLAEVKLAEAEHRALAAETQVELLTASVREKH